MHLAISAHLFQSWIIAVLDSVHYAVSQPGVTTDCIMSRSVIFTPHQFNGFGKFQNWVGLLQCIYKPAMIMNIDCMVTDVKQLYQHNASYISSITRTVLCWCNFLVKLSLFVSMSYKLCASWMTTIYFTGSKLAGLNEKEGTYLITETYTLLFSSNSSKLHKTPAVISTACNQSP